MTVEQIASVCHEVNRAYCVSLDDYTHAPWDLAPEWQRESAMQGVEAVKEDPDRDPSDSHRDWMETKLSDGWKYGETKDSTAKTHPCLLPFDQLPREQQAKDFIFIAVARSLLNL